MQSFSHAKTPDALSSLNELLFDLLSQSELDSAQLQALVDQRHTLVVAHLDSLESSQKQQFVALETPVNDYLNTVIGAMFKESSTNLFNLHKGLRAVNKYKQTK